MMTRCRKFKTLLITILVVLVLICGVNYSIFAANDELTSEDILDKAEKIKDFDGGKLVKIKDKDIVKDVIVFDDGTYEDYDAKKFEKYLMKLSKLTDKLQKEIDKSSDKDKISVSIWLNDIDLEKIKEKVKDKLDINDFATADEEKIQAYVEDTRLEATQEYALKNSVFFTKYIKNEDILYVSKYAPNIIARVQKKDIAKLEKNDDIVNIDIFEDVEKSDEVAKSIPNINANYTRDNIHLTGWGVKVGIIEMGYPDMSNSQMAGKNITFDISKEEASKKVSSHATRVTSIIAGNTQGIVPNSTLYVAAAYTRMQDYEKIEWLLNNGVNVINYSSGYADIRGEYSDMARWMDHIANQHNVMFVKSAGNVTGGNNGITDPGMAYNIETVGSISDNDSPSEPVWNDDVFSYFSCFGESSGGYKPDITAPGQGIDIAGYTANNGTSFSAPHVVGVIAQMFQQRYDLRVKPAAMKSILAAGTMHTTADDYGDNLYSPYYSNKEGAGVVDAKGAFDITGQSKFDQLQLSNSQFPYQKYYYISTTNKPLRVSLAWIKQNEVNGSHPVGSVIERELSDLDLYLYGPDGNLVAYSISAVNNVEVLEYKPLKAGNYKIVVDGYLLENLSEVIGLSWN